MNCVRCNMPLEANARFCRNCGLPVAVAQPQRVFLPSPQEQATEETMRIDPLAQRIRSQAAQPYVPQNYQQPPPSPVDYYQARATSRDANSRSAVVNAPRRRNPLGCVLGCLGTLILLALLLGATWFFALRPYIQDAAMTQMDDVMTSAVNQIPPIVVPVTPGTTVPVSESAVNALLTNASPDTNVVQGTNIQITPSQILLDFKVYGQDCTITAVPQAKNGTLVATDVKTSGIISLILAPKSITTLLNKHLQDAQTRIGHNIAGVRLLDQEIDITFE